MTEPVETVAPVPAPPQRRTEASRDYLAPATTVGVASVTFWLAFDNGTYGVTSRSVVAVVAAWAIVLSIASGVWLRTRPAPIAWVAAGLLVAFALFAGASAAWGASAEKAITEMDRTLLYASVFVLAVIGVRRSDVTRFSDGLAIGLTGVTAVALASRFFPGLLPDDELPRYLPDAYSRLSYPVNYWNGLAVISTLAVPLLLRIACEATREWRRALALAPLPAIACVVYLASSRTGAAAALAGAASFIALTDRRWRASSAAVLGLIGSVAAVAFVANQSAIVHGLDSPTAASEGRLSTVVVAAIGAAIGATFVFGERRLGHLRVPRGASRAVLMAASCVAVVAVLALDPVRRWDDFTRKPPVGPAPTYIENHFLSANGNWRWQFWNAAIDMFRERPLVGHGAATFEAWWSRNGDAAGFVGNGHSLYFQTLGELGAIGLLLVLGFVGVGVGAGVVRSLRSPCGRRTTTAALGATFFAYAVSVGLDWMWQLTVVSIVGAALLGLVVGPATERNRPSRGAPRAARIAVALAAMAIVLMQSDLFVTTKEIEASQAAAGDGNLARAAARARWARALEPWAATPYLQLALVAEQANRVSDARRWIYKAIDRDSSDWRLWLVAYRIDRKAGNAAAARIALQTGKYLNPRSPVFAGVR